MSSTEKKLIFKADNQTSSTTNQIFNDIDKGIKKNSSSLKEQNSLYLEQIKILKERNRLQESGVNKIFSEAGKMSPGLDKEYKIGEAKEAKRAFDYDKKQNEQVIGLLGAIVKENQKSNTTANKVEQDQNKKLKQAEDFKIREGLRKEVRDDPKKVRQKIKEAEGTVFEGIDEEGIRNLKYQKNLLPAEKKEQSMFAQVFAGTLAAGIVQKIASSLGQITGAQSGEQAFNSLLGGIPVIGGILGGANDRAFNEQYGVQTKSLGLRALTGSNIAANSTGSLAEKLGYSSQESFDLQGGLIKAAGNRSGNNSTNSTMLLQKSFGLSTETITQIVKDLRTTRSSADVMQIAADVIKANPELRKDQTKFAEILQQTSTLTNQLASQSENINIRNNIGMIGALRSVGGSFADPNLGTQKFMSINQSLTNPGTEYQKARSFGVLSGTNPGASYFETLEAQEKGLGQKGYLSGILKQLKREGGDGENFMLGINQNLGLSASSSRKLAEAYNKNPSMFDDFSGSKGDIDKILGGNIAKRAEENVSQKDKDKAILDNNFALGALDGTMKVASQTIAAAVDRLAGLLGSNSQQSKVASEAAVDPAKWASALKTIFSPNNHVFSE